MNINGISIKEKTDNIINGQTVANTGNAGAVSELYKNVYSTAATLENGSGSVTEYREPDKSEKKEEVSATALSADAIKTLTDNISTDDYLLYEKMGFAPDKDDPTDIVTVSDRIKIQMAVHGGAVYGDIDIDTLKNMYGDTGLAYQIAGKLKENGVSAEQSNVDEVARALSEAQELGKLTDGAKLYLLNNNLTLSVDNVYMAEHAEAAGSINKNENMLTDEQWESLSGQINDMLNNAGIEISADDLQNVRWMIENKIPVTVDNVVKMNRMSQFSGDYSTEEWIDYIAQTMAVGAGAGDTLIIGSDASDIAEDFVETVENVTNEELQYIIKNNYTLNVKNMKEFSDKKSAGQKNENPSGSSEKDVNVELIKAKRQLEEIRLMMTVKVGVKMLVNGINIDTEPMQNMVDELKKLEENYASAVFDMTDVDRQSDKMKIFSDTMGAVEVMKSVPAYLLGNVMSETTDFTVSAISEEGAALKNRFDMANQAYETMQTAPRKDLGDSITKAFASVDNILDDIGMEITESSERAVRILAYNNMELTSDNIDAMKRLDMEVTTLFDNMKPKTVVHLISKGINPLNTNIYELNDRLSEINMEINADDTEKYSEYLWKLEHNSEISETDRDTYIGIYRLLNLVAKGDRSVIGAIVNEGAEVTMNNMLKALRSNRAKGMDKTVDDKSDIVEKVVTGTSSISAQLSGFMNDDMSDENNDDMNRQNEAYQSEQRYVKQSVEKINDDITPQKLSEAMKGGDIMNMPMERLAEYMSENTRENYSEDAEYYAEQIRQMRECTESVNEDVLRVLLDSGQASTIENVMTASYMMSDNLKLFGRLKKLDDDKKISHDVELIQNAEGTEDDINNAYDNLTDYIDGYVSDFMMNGGSRGINELLMMKKSMHMIRSMGRNSMYHVPVEINEETAGVRVTIIKGGTEKGKVTVDVYSETFGKISAEFNIKGNVLDGVIAADEQNTVSYIEGRLDMMEQDYQNAGYNVKGVSGQYCSNVHYGMWSGDNENDDKVSNSQLYDVAKIFIKNIKEWEKA